MAKLAVVFFALSALCLLSFCQGIEEEDDVLVLTTDNFDEALETHKLLLVEFYAPWCGHCKALAPEYAKAASFLKKEESEIRLAKVDATQEPSLGEKFSVEGYPTIKLFRNGKPSDYSGGRTGDEIVLWLQKKTGPAAKTLSDQAAVERFTEAHEVVVIGSFADETSEKAKAFLEAASSIDSVQFGISREADVAAHLKLKGDGVVLLKKFDEGRAVFSGDFTPEAITEFVNANSSPLVIEFTDETAQAIFGGSYKKQLLVFASKGSSSFDELSASLREVAAKHRGKILFVTINTDYDDNARILEFFHIKDSDVPTMRIVSFAEENMLKYVPEKAGLAEDNIDEFVQGVLDKKFKPHLNSEEIPDDWDSEDVKVVVGKNFQDVVINSKKHVLIEFYAPWCGHCKQLAPIWDKVGQRFSSTADVTVAKMDSTANEVEDVQVSSFPTIMLFVAGEKSSPVEYKGPRDYESLVRFVESGGQDGAAAPEDDGSVLEDDLDEEEVNEDEEEGAFEDLEETPEEAELMAQAQRELEETQAEAQEKDEL